MKITRRDCILSAASLAATMPAEVGALESRSRDVAGEDAKAMSGVFTALFTPFKTETAAMHSTNLYTIADADCRCSLRAKFLGDAIPATSFAMGANATNGLEEHYDMQDVVQDNDWTSGRVVNDERKWFHSDIKNVAYFYLHQVFNRIKSGH